MQQKIVQLSSRISFTIFVFNDLIKLKSLPKKIMKKVLFKGLAKLNKTVLPSYSKKDLDLSKATKIQLAIIGWRAYVTMNALD